MLTGGEESRAFLQARLCFLAKLLLVVEAGFYVAVNATNVVHPDFSLVKLIERGNAWQLASMIPCVLAWAITRSGRRSRSFLLGVDLAMLFAVVVLLQAAAIFGTVAHRPDLQAAPHVLAALITVVLVTARAIIVPAQARWTAFVSAVAALPLLPFAAVAPTALATPMVRVPYVAVWGGVGVAFSTLASRVIYELRQRVEEAQQLGQYTLIQKLGEGGMGVVYRAEHALLRRPTAVKLLRADTAERALRRFEREVQVTARLTHPNTVAIYDYGHTADGIFYYAMELLDGLDLQAVVDQEGPMSPVRARHVLMQIAGSLAEAHAVGLVHRDVKPANVLLCLRPEQGDVAKVLDFGLVKDLGDDPTRSLTYANAVVGTPLYISPEGIQRPQEVDARADLYSFGALAYFLVTGRPPFLGGSMVEVCMHHLQSTPERPTSIVRDLPIELERVILSCLAKDPAERPESAAELRRALARIELADWTEADAERWWAQYRERPVRPAATGSAKSIALRPTLIDRRGALEAKRTA